MRRDAGEPATRTIVVVDLVGSTVWRAEHGDTAADDLLTRFERLVADVVADHDGRVVANHGDGFVTSFGSASYALMAAARIRNDLAGLPVDDVPPLRVGIAAGDVVERGRELLGFPVIEAARLEAEAAVGEILCTEPVRALAGTRAMVSYVQPRTLSLRGLPDLVQAWAVDTAGLDRGARGRLSSPAPVLPPTADVFVGRDVNLDRLGSELSAHRVVTVVGTGGVGKTRLATELAHARSDAFADGVYFVRLESATTVPDAIDRIAKELRLPSNAQHGGAAELARAVGALDALVVLDNCEQAIEPLAEVVAALVAGTPSLRLLCTSRQPLDLAAVEHVHRLEPLVAPDAEAAPAALRDNDSVRLFVARSAAHGGPDPSDGDVTHIADIVRRVEGLPLAIELAAARTNVLSPQGLSARADELFELIANRAHDRPERHHTMAATLEWSLSLLDQADLDVVVAVAVFAGGASFDALEAVTGLTGGPLLDALSTVIDRSLVRRTDERFTMLASLRELILERDDLAALVDRARDRHVDHFERLADEQGSLVQLDPRVLAAFSAEHENFGLALDRLSDTSRSRALRLAGQLALYWVLAGRAGEGDRRLTRALDGPGEAPPGVLAGALRGGAMAAGLSGRYERSGELLERARAIYEGEGRVDQVAYCDHWIARNAVVRAHFGALDPAELVDPIARLRSAIAVFTEAGDRFGVLLAYPYLGWAHLLRGEIGDAESRTDELVELAGASGIERVVAYAEAHAAFIRFRTGSMSAGDRARLARSIEVLRAAGDNQNLIIVLAVQTAIHLAAERESEAAASMLELVRTAHSCDSVEWEPIVLGLGAYVAAIRGDWTAAGEVGDLLERTHDSWRMAMANIGVSSELLEHALVARPAVDLTTAEACHLLQRVLEDTSVVAAEAVG